VAQLTFPESMDKLDVNDPAAALRVVENYIGYICERTDFALRNVTKNVTAAGVSSVEILVLISAMQQTLAALQSTVNQLNGSVNSLSGQVTALRTTVGDANGGLVKDVADLTTSMSGVQSSISTIQDDIEDLDRRVTALEQAQPSGT